MAAREGEWKTESEAIKCGLERLVKEKWPFRCGCLDVEAEQDPHLGESPRSPRSSFTARPLRNCAVMSIADRLNSSNFITEILKSFFGFAILPYLPNKQRG